jgi:hypothetical protein
MGLASGLTPRRAFGLSSGTMRPGTSARPAILVAVFVAIAISGCSSSPVPSPSAAIPSETVSVDQGGLPPGCHPIELNSPDGEAVSLDGIWVQDPSVGRPYTWWIRAQGDCVWGTGIVDDYADTGASANHVEVQTFSGVLTQAFTITGEIVSLGPNPPGFLPPIYSPIRFKVEFKNGQTTLREDREPGVQGPRCPDPAGFCPPPLLLHPR